MDEHEQGEQVRAWLRQNGSTIVSGIVLGIAAIVGVNWWQNQQAERSFAAGTEYQRLVLEVDAGRHEQARAHLQSLGSDFARSPYAVLGALRVAAMEVEAGDHAAALESLDAAIGTNSDAALDGLLRLRAAQLELAAGDAEAALRRLGDVGEEYAGLAAELRGDAHFAQGRAEQARDAYQDAITHMDAAAPARRMVELKLLDLGGDIDLPESEA